MTTAAAHADIQPRIVRTLMGAQVLGGVGMAAGIAVGALLAEDISGKESLAGLGTTFQVLGGALLAIPTARIMARRGRGTGLQVALGLALLGTVLIVISAVVRSFPLLLLGMMLFGGGTTANSQSRYAAADLAPPERRGRDLSMVVWATTIGSVVGPNLVGPGKALAGIMNLPQLVGTFVFSIAGFAAAMPVIRTFLHPDPLLTARASAAASVPADVVGVGTVPVTGAKRDEDGSIGRGLQVVRSNATAAIAIAIVALGHFVMVSVMVMTPIHMKHGHAELEVIGFVISMHIAGMFVLSPLVGWAVDRLGAPIVAGFGGFVLIGAVGTVGQRLVGAVVDRAHRAGLRLVVRVYLRFDDAHQCDLACGASRHPGSGRPGHGAVRSRRRGGRRCHRRSDGLQPAGMVLGGDRVVHRRLGRDGNAVPKGVSLSGFRVAGTGC